MSRVGACRRASFDPAACAAAASRESGKSDLGRAGVSATA
ncbi:hypothetical protein BSIN_3860 [Burkholderia singularis]|uniref:Uncharacterized protein n=1 Tax=Burkholderia singularis TaxID=1503053 RepID=A0A238H6P9_9BURK|nr:hypothetical protein BSIN_3860 [Burkholderia singularis]